MSQNIFINTSLEKQLQMYKSFEEIVNDNLQNNFNQNVNSNLIIEKNNRISYDNLFKTVKYGSLQELFNIALADIIINYPKIVFLPFDKISKNYNTLNNITYISLYVSNIDNVNNYDILNFNIPILYDNINDNKISIVNSSIIGNEFVIECAGNINFNNDIIFLESDFFEKNYLNKIDDFSYHLLIHGIKIPLSKEVNNNVFTYEELIKIPQYKNISYNFLSNEYENYINETYKLLKNYDDNHANKIFNKLIPENITSLTISDNYNLINEGNFNILLTFIGIYIDKFYAKTNNLIDIPVNYLDNFLHTIKGQKNSIISFLKNNGINENFILVNENDVNIIDNKINEYNVLFDVVNDIVQELLYIFQKKSDTIDVSFNDINCITNKNVVTTFEFCKNKNYDECNQCFYENDIIVKKYEITPNDLNNNCNNIQPNIVFDFTKNVYIFQETENYNPSFIIDLMYNCNDDNTISYNYNIYGGIPPYNIIGLEENYSLNDPYYCYVIDSTGCISNFIIGTFICEEQVDCSGLFLDINYECLEDGTIISDVSYGGMPPPYEYEGIGNNEIVNNGQILYGKVNNRGCIIEKSVIVNCDNILCQYLELQTLMEVISLNDEDVIEINLNFEVFGDIFNNEISDTTDYNIYILIDNENVVGNPLNNNYTTDSGASKFYIDRENIIDNLISINVNYTITIDNCQYNDNYVYEINLNNVGNHIIYNKIWND